MATERWTDERLDQLATDVSNLRVTAEALLAIAQLHQQSLETSQRNFEAISIEYLKLPTVIVPDAPIGCRNFEYGVFYPVSGNYR